MTKVVMFPLAWISPRLDPGCSRTGPSQEALEMDPLSVSTATGAERITGPTPLDNAELFAGSGTTGGGSLSLARVATESSAAGIRDVGGKTGPTGSGTATFCFLPLADCFAWLLTSGFTSTGNGRVGEQTRPTGSGAAPGVTVPLFWRRLLPDFLLVLLTSAPTSFCGILVGGRLGCCWSSDCGVMEVCRILALPFGCGDKYGAQVGLTQSTG